MLCLISVSGFFSFTLQMCIIHSFLVVKWQLAFNLSLTYSLLLWKTQKKIVFFSLNESTILNSLFFVVCFNFLLYIFVLPQFPLSVDETTKTSTHIFFHNESMVNQQKFSNVWLTSHFYVIQNSIQSIKRSDPNLISVRKIQNVCITLSWIELHLSVIGVVVPYNIRFAAVNRIFRILFVCWLFILITCHRHARTHT